MPFVHKARCMVFCGLVFHEHPYEKGKLINSGCWIIPRRSESGWHYVQYEQGKFYLTSLEEKNGVVPYRPCQWIVSCGDAVSKAGPLLTASICYDATDLTLASDLRNITDAYIISALNQDVATFDTMVSALHYHMYQHVILANTGEFGGTSVHAPFKRHFEHTVLHHHGNEQVAISFFEIDFDLYKDMGANAGNDDEDPTNVKLKTPPAGWSRWRNGLA
jgi:hypothetical protein